MHTSLNMNRHASVYQEHVLTDSFCNVGVMSDTLGTLMPNLHTYAYEQGNMMH